MKIENSGPNPASLQQASDARRTQKTDRSEKTLNADTRRTAEVSGDADISKRGKEMALAKSAADQAPEVREDKIAELRKRIANKDFNVDPLKVADRMVDNHMATAKAFG